MNYSSLTKDELLQEVDKRKSAGRELGVDSSSTKADIIASLEIDDDDVDEHVNGALPDGKIADLPDGPSESSPANSEYRGVYIQKDTGEEFALAVVADDPRGRTHKLKNKAHFWEGSESDFRLNFDKK